MLDQRVSGELGVAALCFKDSASAKNKEQTRALIVGGGADTARFARSAPSGGLTLCEYFCPAQWQQELVPSRTLVEVVAWQCRTRFSMPLRDL